MSTARASTQPCAAIGSLFRPVLTHPETRLSCNEGYAPIYSLLRQPHFIPLPSPNAMKRFFSLCCALTLPFLLTGFFGLEPTWDSINATIDRQYPRVGNITIDELKAALDQGRSPVLIDVRENDEFAVSHLPNAINVKKVSEITNAKDAPMVIYCSVGVRSAAFAEELMAKGFTKVKNLRGSIFAWANVGYPLRRGASAVKTVHPYNKKWGTLLNQELHMYRVDALEAEKAR